MIKYLSFFIIAIFCFPVFAEEEPVMMAGQPEISARTKRMANKYQNEIKAGKLKKKTNEALNAIIRLAAYKLNKDGHKEKATKLIYEWEHNFSRVLEDSYSRGITDHKPLSAWLAGVSLMLDVTLGHEVCHSLRLDDLITINYAIPVVISCIDDVDEIEYFLHFVEDDTPGHGYRGLGPVVIYWTSFFVCTGFTWGSGFLYCSPISMGVEYLAKEYVCPALNEPLWKWSCKKQ